MQTQIDTLVYLLTQYGDNLKNILKLKSGPKGEKGEKGDSCEEIQKTCEKEEDDFKNQKNGEDYKVSKDDVCSKVSRNTKVGHHEAKEQQKLKNYMYKPDQSIIYQNIFDALDQGVITKYGNPIGYDITTHKVAQWNQLSILNIGNGIQANGNGILIDVPQGYNIVWVRILNDRWQTFRMIPQDVEGINQEKLKEIYAGGFRNINEISPDGASSDRQHNLHKWLSIPVRYPGKQILHSEINGQGWISGIAFGKNLWGHAGNSAIAYYWTLNGGTPANWTGENWNNDQLAFLSWGKVYDLKVPVIPNGKDKIIYIIDHNDNWEGGNHGPIKINGRNAERFRDSFGGPFANHFNNKKFMRYMATFIPKEWIQPDDSFVTLQIDQSAITTGNVFYFRQIGTHDYIF